jgi:hypothetical protein
MQTLGKNFTQFKMIRKFYKIQIANFTQYWTTNSSTNQGAPAHIEKNIRFFNAWTVFNRNQTSIRLRVDHSTKTQTKDFQSSQSRLAFLMGQSKN